MKIFPFLNSKYDSDSFFSPSDYIEYRKKLGDFADLAMPDGIVFVYDRALMQGVMSCEDLEKIDLFSGELYLLRCLAGKIGIVSALGIGPSGVVTSMEEFIAMGVKKFMSVGLAGGLQASSEVGDYVICDKAIRDEGVSRHYLPPAKFVEMGSGLKSCLENAFIRRKVPYTVGATWTTDAPFRETIYELKKYQAEGVMTVEMEASAFVISDSLADLVWDPQFRSPLVISHLQELYEISIEALATGPYCLPQKLEGQK